ncbi:MAG: pyridine nucleotide-disulfide oxidoreductase [Frankiales bacterium]|nr:pyridine nucleotide-disulfide oxidoreductase [Frankiales bacterium]
MDRLGSADRPLRVAIVGAGPAGIYAADVLMKSDTEVSIDLYERQPAPFGLIRYGVAPDHPRIKGIVKALHQVLSKPEIRLIGNVEYGVDVKLDDLRRYYDAIVFTTGAEKDRDLDVPGIDKQGSFGGADFVSWFDGHPDVPREWPLGAEQIAVVGAGNVGLDVARMLSKTADELLVTEIPDNVYRGLAANPVREVHVFARRGPAQAKFTPLELRELDHSPNVEVIVNPEDIEYDDGSVAAINSDNQTKLVVRELERYAMREPGPRPRKLFLHFFESPVEVLGGESVEGFRTERTELTGDGNVRGTGQFTDWPVQAIYRCVGYRSTELPGLPWDSRNHVVPHSAGRVLDLDGSHLSGVYVNGWVKRGPVGLIGHTKGDAIETVGSLLADLDTMPQAAEPSPDAVAEFLDSRGVAWTTWDGWQLLDAHELALGEAFGPVGDKPRERVKVVDRQVMIDVSRAASAVEAGVPGAQAELDHALGRADAGS